MKNMKRFKTLERFFDNVKNGNIVELMFKDDVMFNPDGVHIKKVIGYYNSCGTSGDKIALTFNEPFYRRNITFIDPLFIKEYRIL